MFICIDHLETAAQRQLGKMFICICLFVLKFEQYCRNSRKAGCANFSTAGNIIRAKSLRCNIRHSLLVSNANQLIY